FLLVVALIHPTYVISYASLSCLHALPTLSFAFFRLGTDRVLFLNDPATTDFYTLSLHVALPICRKIILIKQELLLLVYELNRSGLLAENEKIRPILAQLEKLLLCDLSPSTNDSVKN